LHSKNKIEKLVHLVGVVIRIRKEALKKGDLGVVHPVVLRSSTVLGNYITVCTT